MKINTQFLQGFFLFIFLFYSSLEVCARPNLPIGKPSLFQTLANYNSLVIQTDLDTLLLNKNLNEYYQPAHILFYGPNQTTLKFDAKVKARGKFRRVKCDLPPLKINFSKSELADQGFNKKFDKFKLVSHCLLSGNANDALLKEQCVYKMYNNISEYSFRVKSFTIVYQDIKNPRRTIRGECFLIEPNKEMAFRHEGELIDTFGLTPNDVTPESYHHLILFNYMIGNTDWNILQQKNIKFLRREGEEKMIVVPYDFDNSKIVNPPYFAPYPAARRKKTNNRYVKNKFLSKEALLQELLFFQGLENYQFTSCDECEKLSKSEKKKMKFYLKPFFKSIKKPVKMQKLFLE